MKNTWTNACDEMMFQNLCCFDPIMVSLCEDALCSLPSDRQAWCWWISFLVQHQSLRIHFLYIAVDTLAADIFCRHTVRNAQSHTSIYVLQALQGSLADVLTFLSSLVPWGAATEAVVTLVGR